MAQLPDAWLRLINPPLSKEPLNLGKPAIIFLIVSTLLHTIPHRTWILPKDPDNPKHQARLSNKSPLNAKATSTTQAMSSLLKIRQHIVDREYYMSSHAEEEMLDDNLERANIENTILKGFIHKRMPHDSRGTRYRIEGPALNQKPIHVICRFRESANLIVITVYAL